MYSTMYTDNINLDDNLPPYCYLEDRVAQINWLTEQARDLDSSNVTPDDAGGDLDEYIDGLMELFENMRDPEYPLPQWYDESDRQYIMDTIRSWYE